MPDSRHEKAQELSSLAELARVRGDREQARSLYGAAAVLEGESLAALPADKPRSRGILAVSYAALLFKAGLYDRAELAIGGLLADPSLEGSFRDSLRELLQVTWEEQLLLRDGWEDSGAEILVALRGGKIGIGTAPAEIAVHYLNGFHLLTYRVAECDAGLPLRKHGPPPKEIQAALQARATQPVAGSYRFSIKLVEPIQGELFPVAAPPKAPDGRRISRTVVEVLRAVATNDQPALERAVPLEEYRLALARLARNVVPSGDALSEVEIRAGSDGPLGSIRLAPELRRNVNEAIRALTPAADRESREEAVVGTLRAVNLDRRWLKIVRDSGEDVTVRTNADELDDVIGPMVNRKVAARVQIVRGGRRLLDLELQED